MMVYIYIYFRFVDSTNRRKKKENFAESKMSKVYPLLTKLNQAPSTLCPQLRTILLAAGHVANGDASATVAAFQHIEKSWQSKAYDLAIVQAAPFIGIPRVLHSAAALQACGITGNECKKSIKLNGESTAATNNFNILTEKGEQAFLAIYGRNDKRVRDRLRTFDKTLENWIVTCVYGFLLSRHGKDVNDITLRERELCAVAALCVDNCANVQLASHIRGAILTGATAEEVFSVVEQTKVVCESAAPAALAVWQTYSRARYAL